MAQFDNRYAPVGVGRAEGAYVDEGLRAYMLRVYNYMAGGVFLTGLVAYMTYTMAVVQTRANGGLVLSEFGQVLFNSPLKWVVMLAPLAFVFFLSFRVYQMSVGAAQAAFWLFAAVMGVSLSSIFLVFTKGSIAQVFFITAAMFVCLSIYGYTTKKDLSGWGTFLFMGVIGLVLASLVNIFLASSALQFAISVIGVLVFAGLTAYDTQQIKDNYYAVYSDATLAAKSAIMGALNLYLDFINMFTSMLQLFGNRE
jgi:FtsH-binding integral membrane protein